MKKIFLIIILGFVSVLTSYSQEFDNKQLEIRLDLVKYLTKEGFSPQIDKDGDVKFSKDDTNYYFIINKNWKNSYLVTLYCQYSYDENYNKKSLNNCISAIAQYKLVKLYCMENSYSYRADIFCQDAEIIKASFYSLISEMEKAQKDIYTLVSTGVSHLDVLNDLDGIYDEALNYYRNEDYKFSYRLFSYLANRGYDRAYGYMGMAFQYGEGIERDSELMIHYYTKAIDSGYLWCAYPMGLYYKDATDYKEALRYLEMCNQDEHLFRSKALYYIGSFYENGEGVSVDLSKAISYYKESVKYATELESNARLALRRLGVAVESKEDFEKAYASTSGMSGEEMYERGEEYEYGLKDRFVSLPDAYAYYMAAAKEDVIKAYVKLGDIYVNEFYPFNDKKESDKYYKKAAKLLKKEVKNSSEACYTLGYLYQNGLGMDRDLNEAKTYYKKASIGGVSEAAWCLGMIYKNEMNYSEAFKFFLKAAEEGHGMAMFELAKFYEDGLGVSSNTGKAKEWYTKCSESNCKASKDAEKALERLSSNDGKGL